MRLPTCYLGEYKIIGTKLFWKSKSLYGALGALLFFFCLGIAWVYFQREPFFLAHDLADDSYQENLLEIFSSRIELHTKKNIQIKTKNVAHSTFWPTSRILTAVMDGTYAFGNVYLEHLAREDPLFFLDTLPLLAVTYEQAQGLWDVMEPYTRQWMESRGLVYLFSVPCVPQDLFLDREIKTESSLRGLKIRAHGQMSPEYLSLLGMTPVRFLGPIYYEYIKSAPLNGFLSNRDSAYGQTSIHAPYYYPVHYGIPRYVVVMNKKLFHSLPSKTKQYILESSQLAGRLAVTMAKARALERGAFYKTQPIPKWLEERSEKTARVMFANWESLSGHLGAQFIERYRKRLQDLHVPLPFLLERALISQE